MGLGKAKAQKYTSKSIGRRGDSASRCISFNVTLAQPIKRREEKPIVIRD